MTVLEYFLENERDLVWHPDLNGTLDPGTLTLGSHKFVWWRCEKGHSWQGAVYNVIANGCGCPYCWGIKPVPGQSDLATQYPDIAKLWDSQQNAPLTPADVTSGSKRRVWWRCKKGHSWQAKIYSIARDKTGCPYCTGTRPIPGQTDLATVRPDIVAQWDHVRNGSLDPRSLLPSSHEKVWWKCDLGHSWQAAPFSRTRQKSSGCPYCTGRSVLLGFNDLQTLKPKLAREWYQPLNNDLKPSDVTLGCNKRVWWCCSDGHVWRSAIFARTKKNGTGCPVCAGVAKQRRIRYYEAAPQTAPTRPETAPSHR